MNFFQAIGSFFRQYVSFQGRALRAERWYVLLLYIILITAPEVAVFFDIITKEVSNIIIVVYVVLFLPSLALNCRRLHDINMSGWKQLVPNLFVWISCVLYFIALNFLAIHIIYLVTVMLIMSIVALFLYIRLLYWLYFKDGDYGNNDYGPSIY